jgi:hypothetical protein
VPLLSFCGKLKVSCFLSASPIAKTSIVFIKYQEKLGLGP